MKTLGTLKRFATQLWKDERGAEGLEKLLIIAALVLPLLAVLIFFGDDIKEWLVDKWSTVQDDATVLEGNPF